jgi:TRAP-type C4-dicarboxylate transport system permease small subunit
MDLLRHYLPSRLQATVDLLGSLVFIAVAALIIYQAYFSIAKFTHHSLIASLPMNLLHAVIPASFVMMAAVVILQGVSRLGGHRKSDANGPAGQ